MQEAQQFADKAIWITGASSGIGRALALALSAQGALLILSGRRADALADIAAKLAGPSLILPFEVTDHDSLPAITAQALAWQGKLDGLINNAGISQRALAVECAPQVYQRIIDVDLTSPILLTQAALPALLAAGDGIVVNICSIAGIIGVPLRTAYSAAKAGLASYGDALRAECAQSHGLAVLNVFPGSIRTDVARNALAGNGAATGVSDDAIENGMDVDDCAAKMLDAMAARQAELVIAEGGEAKLSALRHSDPATVFATVAGMGARLMAERSTRNRQQNGQNA